MVQLYVMETKLANFAQLFLRMAIALSFLSAVADRFGFWGSPGSAGVSWGNWQNFVNYSNTLNFYLSPKLGEIAAIIATTLEMVFAALLVLGFKTKLTAIASAILLLMFTITMSITIGLKAPFDYSVWTGIAACMLLSSVPKYKYSIDNLYAK